MGWVGAVMAQYANTTHQRNCLENITHKNVLISDDFLMHKIWFSSRSIKKYPQNYFLIEKTVFTNTNAFTHLRLEIVFLCFRKNTARQTLCKNNSHRSIDMWLKIVSGNKSHLLKHSKFTLTPLGLEITDATCWTFYSYKKLSFQHKQSKISISAVKVLNV